MLLYSIGEVAQLCDINPVTLRAWQRRYGLLKPKRSEGGHRLFDNEDVARIRAIRIWIERGVPVNMVKALLDGKAQPDHTANWALLQQQLLTLLHTPSPSKIRRRLFELGREYPAERLIENVLRPLRSQLSGDHELLQMLRGLLDGVIIEYATFCMIRARKNRPHRPITGMAQCRPHRAVARGHHTGEERYAYRYSAGDANASAAPTV